MRPALALILTALLGCAGASHGGSRTYTCADMVKHDADLSGSQPSPERVKMCEEHHPSQEALGCFVQAPDHAAFMACGKKFFPND